MEERTERESDRRNGRLVGAAETSKKRAEWRRLHQRNLNILGLAKRKECFSAAERAVGKYAGAAIAKRNRNRAVKLTHEIMRRQRVKVSESRTLARERKTRAKAWRGKGGHHSEGRRVPRRKGRASMISRRCRRKHERVSGRKSSPGRSADSWFHSEFGQT